MGISLLVENKEKTGIGSEGKSDTLGRRRAEQMVGRLPSFPSYLSAGIGFVLAHHFSFHVQLVTTSC